MGRKTVRCRMCQQTFTHQEWLDNTNCNNPEGCGCPQVKRAMEAANQVIDKAKESAGYKVIRLEETIPTNREESMAQLFVNVSPVLSIQVTKSAKRKGK